MASFSSTELNATIKELWDANIEEARYAKGVLLNLIANRSQKGQKGDIIHVIVDTKTTAAGTTGSNGAFTPVTRTPTSVPITINVDAYYAEEYESAAEALSFWTPKSIFNEIAQKVLVEKYDGDIGRLFASLTGTAVGSQDRPVKFGVDAGLASILYMANSNIPLENIAFAVPPVAIFGGIAQDPRITEVCKAGIDKTPLISGRWNMDLSGVPVYMSTLLTKVGSTYQGALLHKSSLGIAFAINNEHESYSTAPANYLKKGNVTRSFYGKAVIRADHGLLINVADS